METRGSLFSKIFKERGSWGVFVSIVSLNCFFARVIHTRPPFAFWLSCIWGSSDQEEKTPGPPETLISPWFARQDNHISIHETGSLRTWVCKIKWKQSKKYLASKWTFAVKEICHKKSKNHSSLTKLVYKNEDDWLVFIAFFDIIVTGSAKLLVTIDSHE